MSKRVRLVDEDQRKWHIVVQDNGRRWLTDGKWGIWADAVKPLFEAADEMIPWEGRSQESYRDSAADLILVMVWGTEPTARKLRSRRS